MSDFDPSLRREHKVIAARLIFKPLEFERFETRIAQFFPKPQEFNGAAIAHPIVDDGERFMRIPMPGDVRNSFRAMS